MSNADFDISEDLTLVEPAMSSEARLQKMLHSYEASFRLLGWEQARAVMMAAGDRLETLYTRREHLLASALDLEALEQACHQLGLVTLRNDLVAMRQELERVIAVRFPK